MDLKGMNLFLSKENINRHIEFLRSLRLKYSILEKSVEALRGKEIEDLIKLKLKSDIKEEAIDLLWKIRSHQLFFDSFNERAVISKESVGSLEREGILYRAFCLAKEKDWGFLYLYLDKQRNPVHIYADSFDGAFVKYRPSLCLDLYEHTYLMDYGFNKTKFLKNALAYFDIERLFKPVLTKAK